MTNYKSIQQDHDNESNEGDALINRPSLVPERNPSSKKHLTLVGVFALVFLLAYNLLGTTKNNAPNNADAAAIFDRICWHRQDEDKQCGPDLYCCHYRFIPLLGKCNECCTDSDCISKIDQPPAGEFGKPMCLDNQCQAYTNGESSQIPSDGYEVWSPSETSDGGKKLRSYKMPRKVYNDGPLMEQVWHFDLDEQEASFDKNKIYYNDTHITIPSFDNMHAGYSRSYNHYDEHETGVVAVIMGDNDMSVVAHYPKVGFVEKYHTMTYDGTKDFTRAEFIKEKAEEQIAKNPNFDRNAWFIRMGARALIMMKVIPTQIMAGLDLALAWQVRRYVSSYPEADFGSVNPSSSASWASHSEKAKQAIAHAKDPSFEREYMKSEQHCKHFEELDGLSYTQESVTFPLGRPITLFSGEVVNSPVHYLGLGVGHGTVHFDPTTSTLEIFYQTFSHSRQHPDVEYSGSYENGLWVAPVTDGIDYVVDPDHDGRGDMYAIPDQSQDTLIQGEEDFTVWARPTEEVCSDDMVDGSFWEEIDMKKTLDIDNVFDILTQVKPLLYGVIGSMPCSDFMRSDYGGGHNCDTNEIAVYSHALWEIRNDKTKELMLAKYWDSWECFYGGRCEVVASGG